MPFRKLRSRMFECDYKCTDISRKIARSSTYVSKRMSAHIPFTIDEIYDICDDLEVPYNEIPEYFPRGGVPE